MAVARDVMVACEQQFGESWNCVVSDGELGFYMRYHQENHIYCSVGGLTVFLYVSGS